MSSLSRRQLLTFFGASAGAAVFSDTFGSSVLGIFGGDSGIASAQLPTSFTPVRLPHPLPIYAEKRSFMATGLNSGAFMQPTGVQNLTSFTAQDTVVVPPEYESYVIVSWGDKVFSNTEEYFGYNCDWTGFTPIGGNLNDGYLFVNHEYNSFPISRLAPEAPADLAGFAESGPIVIPGFPNVAGSQALYGEFFYNMGGSVVRITKSNGRFRVVSDPNNRRYHGLSGLGINSTRADGFQTITSWGTKSYQIGDQKWLEGTGPAATDVFTNVNADGLGNKIIGTAYNCSGGYTPWGNALSCEENFQASAGLFFVGVTEAVLPNGSQTSYSAGTTGATFGLVGEKYGWVVEVDPTNPTFRAKKHTALGRFRHENVALRVEAGKKLIAYQGDDRRGGHTWKYVSSGTVTTPTDKNNSNLFASGTLYVAKFNANGTGTWIPLVLSTAVDPATPSVLGSAEAAARGGIVSNNGNTNLPRRAGIAGQATNGGALRVLTTGIPSAGLTETQAIDSYKTKGATKAVGNVFLSDYYTSQGAILSDAFLAANLAGGTPTARPEDLEVNPLNAREIFIAYTDGAPGGDGYPDSRVFQVSKYTTSVNDTQQSGGLYKIVEDSTDGTGLTFTWSKFKQGGAAGSIAGVGFANVDNLAFDPQGNIWGVTDMSTGLHNGFNTGAAGTQTAINHAIAGNVSSLVGCFGNNWLFFIPTTGPDAGKLAPFAYGPTRCEMTGPTFVGDSLILAVQHPGEDCPYDPPSNLSRTVEMLALNGTLFNQTRTVPRGSNWPSNLQGKTGVNAVPKPSVIGIRRKQPLPGGTFV